MGDPGCPQRLAPKCLRVQQLCFMSRVAGTAGFLPTPSSLLLTLPKKALILLCPIKWLSFWNPKPPKMKRQLWHGPFKVHFVAHDLFQGKPLGSFLLLTMSQWPELQQSY